MPVIAVLYSVQSKRRDFSVKVLRRQNCANIVAARAWFVSQGKSSAAQGKEAVLPDEPGLESNAAIEAFLHAQNRGRWFKPKSILSPQ